jgi:hypothetical protein
MTEISMRAGLKKIGEPKSGRAIPAFPSGFCSAPQSLRQAVRAMDAPASQDWSQVSDIFRDDSWTDEVQGVAWDGSHWIFSANANQSKPGANDKAIYVFKGGQSLGDDKWLSMIKYKQVPHPIGGTKESDDHWGQLCYYDGFVYVSHFWANGPKKGISNVVVFKNNDGFLNFHKWIELERPKSPTDGRQEKAEFQAINPWDGLLYTCFGSGTIHEFFMHDIDGHYTGKTIKFDIPVTEVQGACFSPNGHLYVSTNAKLPGDPHRQTIWYYSALNGHRLGVIPVLAQEDNQELEGICYGQVSFSGGKTAQIHAILLENPLLALDNIFFKSFSSAKPDLV